MLRLTWIVVGIFALWNAAAAASDSDNLPHWSYSQGEGPERWAELSPDFKICGEGREQSPIDLATGNAALNAASSSVHINFDYRAFPLRIVRQSSVADVLNNGHTIQINPEGESALDLDGERFRLVQFHFHAPPNGTILLPLKSSCQKST
jgi:carbonic anhydrase